MYCRYFPCSFLSGLECKLAVKEKEVGRERDFQCWRYGWGEREMFNDGDTGG